MSTTIPQLSSILQDVLIKDANEIGRSSGFIRRQRKFTGASFAQTLVFGWLANPHASLEELCQAARLSGIHISPQGLQERLNSCQAVDFLHQLLQKALTYVVSAQGLRSDLLSRFEGVYIQDSSKIELPALFEQQWQANQKGQSSLKLQTVLDYHQGHLDIQLAAGRQHDCPLQTLDLPKGSLRLADVGYFKVSVFKDLNQRGVQWLSRVPARVGIWQNGKLLHLATWLQEQDKDCIDQEIELSAQSLRCRLIAVRVPDKVIQQRQERVRTEAKDRKSKLKQKTLDLCQWTILITNLPVEELSVEEALRLLRTRWQIELLFKLWKDELAVDEWRSQQPYQILAEVYAKLLAALIQHWVLIVGCWDEPQRSLVKATRTIRKQAFHLLSYLHSWRQLKASLRQICATLKLCRIQKRKTRPATFQLLARSYP